MELQTYESLTRIHGLNDGPHLRGLGLTERLRRLAVRANALILEPIRNELRARKAIRRLETLDDRMLDDIGIRRHDIASVVRNGPKARR